MTFSLRLKCTEQTFLPNQSSVVVRKESNLRRAVYSILTSQTNMYKYKKKLRGLSPQANYTDRVAAAGRRS